MNKEHSLETIADLELVPPVGYVLSESNFPSIPIQITGNGFSLIKYGGNTNHSFRIKIPNQEGIIKLRSDQLNLLLEKQLKADLRIEVKKINDIELQIAKTANKVVPIKSRLEIIVAPGYIMNGSIQFTPDSIEITGPNSILDSVSFIETNILKSEMVTSDKKGRIGLSLINQISSHSQSNIDFEYKIIRLTEKTIEIPLQNYINSNIGDSLLASPDLLKITLGVPIDLYDEINESDIEISLIEQKSLKTDQDYGTKYQLKVDIKRKNIVLQHYEPHTIEVFKIVRLEK